MSFRIGEHVERRNVFPKQRGTIVSVLILACKDDDSFIPMPAYAVDCDDGELHVWLDNETFAVADSTGSTSAG